MSHVPRLFIAVGGRIQRCSTVHCIHTRRRVKINFPEIFTARKPPYVYFTQYALAQAMVQAEGLWVLFTIMADSGWVGFTSDGDEIRSDDIHCELATAVMIMQWAVSSTQLNKRCALGTACLSPVKYQVFRSSLAASLL